ncbi:hypothetical protein B0T14DRAFT_566378 [Immersiella caudata]|uniref:Uncharacterized protein n=1 Tax=Immersiella caudata TaxID=314043 RepID=A0AA39WQ50_9PEZI|nr:hypothetical protein B0T14DRAFT_566378 [Immersiella caudata]
MHSFQPLVVAFFPLVWALATGPDLIMELNIIHQQTTLNSRVSTTAWTSDWSQVLGHSCSASLSSGPFEHMAIHFNVDETGLGSVLLGTSSHPIQGLNKSEQVECSSMYGEVESAVKCTVTMANLDCGDGTCSAEHLHAESFTISVTASASAHGWIDGGFEVQKSVETGTSNSCNAERNERVCVWKKINRTSYQVQNMQLNQCTGAQPRGGPFTMVSPNRNQPSTNFYCVRNQFCREMGAQYEEEATPGKP